MDIFARQPPRTEAIQKSTKSILELEDNSRKIVKKGIVERFLLFEE